MTLQEIKEYQGVAGKEGFDGLIQLFGYTSCSLSKNQALSFAWENKESGHHKVLFHFKWNSEYDHYYMNAGAYDHEEEVLLYDGALVEVISVEDVMDDKGKKIYTLISLESADED